MKSCTICVVQFIKSKACTPCLQLPPQILDCAFSVSRIVRSKMYRGFRGLTFFSRVGKGLYLLSSTSFIASNFNYCPLVWFFTSRESIDKIDKIQERALRFVLKDHISDYTNLLLKSGFDSFRIYAVKCLMIELFKILKGITPNYLSDLFVKADNPYDTRDKYKLIQPLKRTTTYGLRSFQYYGAHVWNMLSINIKAAHSLHEFKSLIRSWPGPKCSCHIY